MDKDAAAGTAAPRAHLALKDLNHVSKVCANLEASVAFYRDLLGFLVVQRPSSLSHSNIEGCWLWRYGLGLHLIQGTPPARPAQIIPTSDHLSFTTDSLGDVEAALAELRVPYVRQSVVEGGVEVKQLFFHDPDRNMLEVCTCDALPLLPIETDVQLSRCHTCAAEAQRLRSSHASSGQGSAGGSSGGDLEAVCEHAAAAEECWLPVEPCAHSAASPAAEHRSTPRAQRRSSAENEEGNVMPPMPGGCCGEGEPAHSVGAVSGSEAGRCECACVGSPAAKAASGGLHSRADKDAEAEELAEMMVAVL